MPDKNEKESIKPVVLIAAGASGGHIVPAIAVGEELLENNFEVIFVGVGKELEKKIIPQDKFKYFVVKFEAVLGRNALSILKLVLKTPLLVLDCVKLIRREKVSLVIGFGGYPCFVPVFSAKLLFLKTILHEQNIHAGLANKVLAKFVDKIFAPSGSNISKTNDFTEVLNPVRAEFYKVSPWIKHNKPLKVLVLGGSQGARNINNAILSSLDFFKEKNINLFHQTGKADFESVSLAYKKHSFNPLKCQPFFDDVSSLLEEADIVISRAGAMSVSEIIAAKRAGIFIPLSISRGHQGQNVSHFSENNQAFVLNDDDNLATSLKDKIAKLEGDREIIQEVVENINKLQAKGSKTSAEVIVEQVSSIL